MSEYFTIPPPEKRVSYSEVPHKGREGWGPNGGG